MTYEIRNSEDTQPYFPLVIGNEEETGMLVAKGSGKYYFPYEFAEELPKYIPNNLRYCDDGYRTFLSNGGLVYSGGYTDEDINGNQLEKSLRDNIERATPECSSPDQAALYIQANEDLIVNMSKNFVANKSKESNDKYTVRIHRRVVDSHENRKGCHDNFGLQKNHELINIHNTGILLGFLATRIVMTGSGYVSKLGVEYSQKLDGVTDIERYGFVGSVYRHDEEETGQRLEIRCNDINISPWAIKIRLGGMALLFATLQTDLVKKMDEWHYDFNKLKMHNSVTFTKNGNIDTNWRDFVALDYQESMCDVFLEELPTKLEIPDHYYSVALEIKQYCEDFRKVLNNDADLTILADRSDFAAKFTRIIEKRTKLKTKLNILNDIQGMYEDLMYDYIGIKFDDNFEATVEYGRGYKIRNNGGFKMTPRPNEVEKAYYVPPADTRAYIRGNLISKYRLDEVNWGIALLTGDPSSQVSFEDPISTKIDSESSYLIKKYAVRRAESSK